MGALSRPALVVLGGLFALTSLSCTDPVLDDQIEALGPETGNPGPTHRPGQPCVLCHSQLGPASDSVFLLAGTVYDSPTRITPLGGKARVAEIARMLSGHEVGAATERMARELIESARRPD